MEKFLKTRNRKVGRAYRNYKNLFEQIKKRVKKLHFSNLIMKYKNNMKMKWYVIKEAIGKVLLGDKSSQIRFITSTDSIAKNFY